MNIKFNRRLFFALAIGFIVSCSRRPELAKTASLSQFDGNWTGEWSWKKGIVTDLEIKSGKIKFSNFPASHDATGEITASGEGEVEFQTEWSTPAPCILVTLPNSNLTVPVYITADKKRLYYPYSTSDGDYIIFSRK